MKTLILILLPLITFGQLRKEANFVPPFDMFYPTGHTITNKTKAVIVFESCLFAASIYFMQTNNEKMYRVTRNTFILSSIPLLTIDLDKPRHKKRRR